MFYYNLYHKVYTLDGILCFQKNCRRHTPGWHISAKTPFCVKRPDSARLSTTLGDKPLYEGSYMKISGCFWRVAMISIARRTSALAILLLHCPSVYGAKGDHKQEKKYLTIGNSRHCAEQRNTFALETCFQPRVSWRGRHRTCVYLYGMLHARCHLLQCSPPYDGDFGDVARHQLHLRGQVA